MPDKPYHNILIIKPSSLGDIVHALPAVISLRKAFPAARLTWLVRNHFAPLLQDIPEIDDVLLFDRRALAAWFYNPQAFKALLAFRKQLQAPKFDLVLDLQGLLRSALFAKMTGCKDRVGLAEAREGARLFYTQVVPPPDSPHILDYYLAVLRQLGVSAGAGNFKLTASPAARQSILKKMAALGLKSKKFLVLIPGSAHISKCWPAERFARVAEALHDRFSLVDIAAVGTAGEKEIVNRIQGYCRLPIADLCGQTSLPELTALFEQSAVVLSNDTGPGHMAAAAGIPLVMIFGHTNPLRLGPYKRPDCIAAVDIEHRGKTIDSQNPDWRIEHVSVEMVIDKVKRQLSEL